MGEAAVRHSHGDGVTHAHATVLWPGVIELLQQLDDFAACLQPEVAIGFRWLLRAGLLATEVDSEPTGDLPGVYDHAWYRNHILSHHEHAADTPHRDTFLYLPSWWPPHTRHGKTLARSPPYGV